MCGRTTYSASSSTSYVLATVDLGKAIKVKVTGAAQGYNNGARYSHSTAKVVKA